MTDEFPTYLEMRRGEGGIINQLYLKVKELHEQVNAEKKPKTKTTKAKDK